MRICFNNQIETKILYKTRHVGYFFILLMNVGAELCLIKIIIKMKILIFYNLVMVQIFFNSCNYYDITLISNAGDHHVVE